MTYPTKHSGSERLFMIWDGIKFLGECIKESRRRLAMSHLEYRLSSVKDHTELKAIHRKLGIGSDS